jgi:hypothetical protein
MKHTLSMECTTLYHWWQNSSYSRLGEPQILHMLKIISHKGEFWLNNLVKLMQNCLYRWNLVGHVAVNAYHIETAVSCAMHFNDMWGLISNCVWISWTFSSVSTFLLDCHLPPQTEPKFLHFFFYKLQDTQFHGDSFLWILTRELPNSLSVSCLPYEGFDYENSFLNHIPHCKSNKFKS